jgi:hypothetical protein
VRTRYAGPRAPLGRSGAARFGLTEEQAVGQILPMVPFDMREETLARVREAASGAMCGEHSTVWCRDDGEPLEV